MRVKLAKPTDKPTKQSGKLWYSTTDRQRRAFCIKDLPAYICTKPVP